MSAYQLYESARRIISRMAVSAGIFALLILIMVFLWVTVETLVAQERDDAIQDAFRTNANLARTFEEHTIRTLNYVDEILLQIKARFEADGERLDLKEFFATVTPDAGVMINAAITDAAGTVILASGPFSRVSLADRPHINTHFQRDTGQTFIGVPVQARINRQWSIVMTRRANRADGSLLGVVSIAVNPLYFSNFYKDVDLGREGRVILTGTDGIIRARTGPDDRGIGVDLSGSALFRHFALAPQGAFVNTSLIDGVSVIFAYRRLKNFPLIVTIGTGTEETLARATERAFVYRVTASVASIAFLCLAGGIIVIGQRDIARRRAAAEQLRESEARFRGAFESSAHGLVWVALDRRFIMANTAFCQMTGYSQDELRTKSWLDVTHSDDAAVGVAATGQLFAGEIDHLQMKKQYVRKGGETFWAQTDVSVVHDELNNPKYFIAHIQDITERLQAEERVRQSQKMEAVGQLTAGIAHDFNNILATVIGNLELLNEGFADDPAEAREFSMSALDGAISAAGLVRSLLAFSRQQSLRPQATCIRTAVTRMETLLRVSLGERIEITIAFAADLWQAMVDVAQIESALLNVALNARDAMPDGGVLTLDAANLHVGGGAFPAGDDLQAGDYVVLSVTDSGGGMAPEVRKRAFEPFFSTKGVGGGSGLGLSMVMGTMQQQGGAVRIDSELGRGTIVHLFLPRAVVIAETPADQASAPACPTGKERILFVEDNEQVRQVVEAMIRSVGYSVTVAKDAEAALALWDDGGQFDLVFTDVVMPGEYTGVDLAGALRARDPHARILLTSGFAYSEEILAKIKELGLEVLSKPYQKVLLADRFRAALDRKAT